MIISGFLGIGKTLCAKDFPKYVIFLNIRDYKWSNKEDLSTINPDWPNNYIEDILINIKKYKFVLISMDKELFKVLRDRNIRYFVAFPFKNCKDEYIERLKTSGCNEDYLKIFEDNFDNWIDYFIQNENNQIRLFEGKYISDKIGLEKKDK